MSAENSDNEDDYEEDSSIVIDNGSFSIKAGFGGDDCPKSQFLTMVATPKHMKMYQKDSYIGGDIPNYTDFDLGNPIKDRIITNWDSMEKIWHHTFYNELKVAPEEHAVLLTETALNHKSNHEKMTQIMFETFNVPDLYITAQQTLALYSYGRTTGYIVDSGYKMTDIVPIYEGYPLLHAIKSLKYGGYHITNELMKNPEIKKYKMSIDSVRDLKEKQINYKLPDGTEISLDSTLKRECVELLFHQKYDFVNIFDDSLNKLDIDIRKDMLKNICLCGGNFIFKGIDERLWTALDIKTKYGVDTKLVNGTDDDNNRMNRKYAVWIGGSILSSLSTFESMWTSKDLYDESGPSIVHRKCFGGGGGGGGGGGSNIGFSVGGSKDIGNFRDCIKDNMMPKESSITFEGIYYDYYFATENKENVVDEEKVDKDKLFYPSYLYSTSKIPDGLKVEDDEKMDGDEYEYFMTVGLNSNLKESNFKRNKQNLVVVMDISGSMSSPFNYSDNIQKMKIANDAIIALLKHLNDDDRVGLVLFNTESFVKQRLDLMKNIDLNKFVELISNIEANGGTDMEIGYKTGVNLYDKMEINDDYDNRIIYLTDAMPNYGRMDAQSLLGMIKECSQRKIGKIYTTMIGVGLDFNTDLVEKITKVNGANYYTVHSKQEFMKRMDDEFEFMVTPLVFNLKLNLKSEGNSCYIYKTYGSGTDHDGDDNITDKEVMNINTLFPSKKTDDGETKGGVVLLQIKKNKVNDNNDNNNNLNMKIMISYEDRKGNKYSNDVNVVFKNENDNDMIDGGDYFDNNGIRKAVLLTRYVLLIKQWIKTMNKTGTLSVSDKYKQIFINFVKYFENEMKEIGDESLEKELKILNKLSTIN